MRTHLLLPLLAAMGCGGDLGTHEACTDAEIEAMNDLAVIIEGVQNKQDVDAARPKVEKIVKRVQEIQAAQRKLGEPSAAEKKRLKAKTDAAGDALKPRVEKATERLESDQEALMALTMLLMEHMPKLQQR